MLHGTKLLLWLRFVISFSIPVSLRRINKKWIENSFFRYLSKGFFAFGILDPRFEPTFTKKILNTWTMEVLCAIIFLFRNREFGDVLALDFSVKTDFVPSQVFLRFFEFLWK